jgi:sterol 14-demethylase
LLHQGPKQLLEQGYKKYGEVFTVPVLNKKITFLIGTDVTPFFFKATDEDMSQQEVCSSTTLCNRPQQINRMFRPLLALQVYQFNVPTFGKGVVFDVDSKIRAEQFKFFASALQSSKLKSYVPLFVKESEVTLQSAR